MEFENEKEKWRERWDRYIERERERERKNEIARVDDGTRSRSKMTDKDAMFREDLKFLTPTEYGNQRVG